MVRCNWLLRVQRDIKLCGVVSVHFYSVNGGWGDWVQGACSVTCGQGSRQSTRACDSPAPAHGGSGCHGDETKTESCDAGLQCPGMRVDMFKIRTSNV